MSYEDTIEANERDRQEASAVLDDYQAESVVADLSALAAQLGTARYNAHLTD